MTTDRPAGANRLTNAGQRPVSAKDRPAQVLVEDVDSVHFTRVGRVGEAISAVQHVAVVFRPAGQLAPVGEFGSVLVRQDVREVIDVALACFDLVRPVNGVVVLKMTNKRAN